MTRHASAEEITRIAHVVLHQATRHRDCQRCCLPFELSPSGWLRVWL
jgi:hypothetical protein